MVARIQNRRADRLSSPRYNAGIFGQQNLMGKISTHVLDIALGKPGAGVAIELYRVDGAHRKLIKRDTTNEDGRCNHPLLEGGELEQGSYEIIFAAGDYFAAQGVALPAPRFLDRISIAFGVADPAQNYHVPLLVSPFAYSTYRGS
ncbi:MAG: 5-hydroxyisourate hydrolase [Herminiimonas sp.]|nr:5-hydroxyisourate hydrolase [Herminiimonas sp.]